MYIMARGAINEHKTNNQELDTVNRFGGGLLSHTTVSHNQSSPRDPDQHWKNAVYLPPSATGSASNAA
jgi:hypothetical protein